MGTKLLKPAFFRDLEFASQSVGARYLFGALYTCASGSGRFPNELTKIRNTCYPPNDKWINSKSIDQYLEELEVNGYIALGPKHIQIVNYRKNELMADRNTRREVVPNWKKIRAEVLKRDNYTCRYCGKREENMHCDHYVPVSKGGTHDLDNLVAACNRCNIKKSASTDYSLWRR